MRAWRNAAIALAFFSAIGSAPVALAVQPDEMLADSTLEARARDLSRELRCMVCQNQSIDDSEAPLARDLRVLVRERLTAGDSDADVLNFLVARYGAFVLLRPPFEWHTAILWFTPAAVLLVGAVAMFAAVRRRRRFGLAGPAPLTAEEERRLGDMINDG